MKVHLTVLNDSEEFTSLVLYVCCLFTAKIFIIVILEVFSSNKTHYASGANLRFQ